MNSKNYSLNLAIILAGSLLLGSCGGGDGGGSEPPCTSTEESEGLTGIWEIEPITKVFLEGVAATLGDDAELDPSELINIGIMLFDGGDNLQMTFCETKGVTNLVRDGDSITSEEDVEDLTGGELFGDMTVLSDTRLEIDANIPGFGEYALVFVRSDGGQNDVCLRTENFERLPRSTVSCIDKPLYSLSETAGDARNTQLTMAVVSGGEIYRIIMNFENTVAVGAYDVALGEVSVSVSSPAFDDLIEADSLAFDGGTVTLTEKTGSRVKGTLDLISTDGQKVLVDFNSSIY